MKQEAKTSVAVVGLGACGLVALKNLREAGFDAVGFDANGYIGGLWEYTEAHQTSVLKTTVANISKQSNCYTDFPYPDATADFPTAAETAQYLNDYADHFDLRRHMTLGQRLQHVRRSEDRWSLDFVEAEGGSPRTYHFDKVALCVGLVVQEPKIPQIAGIESFTGQALHSNAYRRPKDFAGKRVVVVGLGNTGCDTAVDLIGHASEIWMSHRVGSAIFARTNANGKPYDHLLSLRLTKIGGLLNKYLPSSISKKMAILGMKSNQKRFFKVKPEWDLDNLEPPTRKLPIVNDRFIPELHAGNLNLKPALSEISGSTLKFSDGTALEDVDAIVFCTGFRSDYSYMDTKADPTRDTRKDWRSLPGANGRPLPRLYQGIFSLDFPDSLAFLGTSPLTPQAFLNYDISSAAVAQVWTGSSTLPSLQEMNDHVDAQHNVVCQIARTGSLASTNLRNNWEWYKWCDEAAGIGLVKRMGYGLEGWKFYFQDRKLCKLVMDGLLSPHLFRLFDEGKREAWPDARAAVEKVNHKAQ